MRTCFFDIEDFVSERMQQKYFRRDTKKTEEYL